MCWAVTVGPGLGSEFEVYENSVIPDSPRQIFRAQSTVLLHSIRQSRVTGLSKTPKCHGGHG